MDWPAVAACAVAVIGAFGGVYLKILHSRQNIRNLDSASARANKEADAADARKHRKDVIKEQYELIEELKQSRTEDRQLIHDLRDNYQLVLTELALYKAELAVCKSDREYQGRQIDAMLVAMSDANIRVPVVAPPTQRMPKPGA